MKKRVYGRKLGRTKNQRQALFRGLISSLIKEGEILTTLSKAKAIKPEAEKLITKAIGGSVGSRRQMHRTLVNNSLVNKLTDSIAPLFRGRKGGYLRIIKAGARKGDGAAMAKVAFVEDIAKRIMPEPKEPPKAELPPVKQTKETVKRKTKNVKSD